MSAFDFYSHIYCLNVPELPHSDKRKEVMVREFKQLGILHKVDFSIYAPPPWKNFKSNIHEARGDFGNTLSHIKILVDSLQYDGHILIFEDDCLFSKNSDRILDKAIKQLPEAWEVFYLGGKPKSPMTRYSKDLARPGRIINCMSFAINKNAIIKVLKFYADNMGTKWPHSSTDNMLSNYCQKFNTGYSLIDRIASPVPCPSTVKGGNKVYDYRAQQTNAWNTYGVK